MAYRRITTMDIGEIIRLLRAGESDRTIARVLGHNRRTVVRYREWAAAQGLLGGELPPAIQLQRLLATRLPSPRPPQQTSSVAPYAAEIARMRERGMEIAAIRGRLEEQTGQPVSYSAVWRLVRHLEPRQPDPVVRIEVTPGSEGQVDFGYAGLTLDPATGAARRTWVFGGSGPGSWERNVAVTAESTREKQAVSEQSAIERLGTRLRGRLNRRGDADYETARRVMKGIRVDPSSRTGRA